MVILVDYHSTADFRCVNHRPEWLVGEWQERYAHWLKLWANLDVIWLQSRCSLSLEVFLVSFQGLKRMGDRMFRHYQIQQQIWEQIDLLIWNLQRSARKIKENFMVSLLLKNQMIQNVTSSCMKIAISWRSAREEASFSTSSPEFNVWRGLVTASLFRTN